MSSSSEPIEKEAEEAAAAIKRGEAPKPVRGAGGPRSAGPSSRPVDASAHVQFTKSQWQQILADPNLTQNTVLKAAIQQLESEEQVKQRSKSDVYDATAKNWKPRAFVPMHFPAAQGLSHRNVFGGQQISEGMYLKRAGGQREDTNQNRLSRIMYATGTAPPPGPGDGSRAAPPARSSTCPPSMRPGRSTGTRGPSRPTSTRSRSSAIRPRRRPRRATTST